MPRAWPRDSEDPLLHPLLGAGLPDHEGYARRKSQITEPEEKGRESKTLIFTAWQNALTPLLSDHYLKIRVDVLLFPSLPKLALWGQPLVPSTPHPEP